MSETPAIKLDQCDEAVVNKYLAKYELDVEGTLEEKVARLQEHQFTLGAQNLASCDICNGEAHFEEPCVFCGSEDEPEVEEGAPAPKPAPEPAAPKGKKKAGKKKASKKTEKPAAPKGKKKTAKKTKVKSTPVVADGAEVQTVAMLDAEISGIEDAQRDGVRSIWRIGQHLLAIRERNLFTLRKKDGTVQYKSWGAFVKEELGMERSYASKIMAAVKNFSEADVHKIGATKLALLVGLKPAERERLMDKVQKGATQREISDEVAKLGSGARVKQGTGGFKGEMGAGRTPAKSDKLTVVLENPERTLKFTDKNGKGVKSIGKTPPTAREITANGVTIVYSVSKNAEGELELHVTSSRED